MKRVSKPVFFVVAILIVLLMVVSVTGISTQYGDRTDVYIKGGSDIRWGIDIRGGVDVTFTPPEDIDATEEQMDAAQAVIEQRLINLHITDYELYTDYSKDRVVVRFPWKEGESDFDPEAAILELGETALLTFREGSAADGEIVIEGKDVKSASPYYDQENATYGVTLELEDSGKEAFAEATTRLAGTGEVISIWMDDTNISSPQVDAAITDGSASITGSFTADEAIALANKINSGALPFKLETSNYRTIDPTMGLEARDVMIYAGILAYIAIAIFITLVYRLPGIVAAIALLGQIGGSIAAITGFFPFIPSFTLTLPGIAGIILSIGMGVDANIITSARIKEELQSGKSLDGSIEIGYKRAFSAIFDGNLTLMIVAVILMGAFGPTDSLFAKLLSPLFFLFGASAAGEIYSFGYTLLVGAIMNFIFGITASRLMLKSLSRFKVFRNPVLYGGVKQ